MAYSGPLIQVEIVGFFTHSVRNAGIALKGAEPKVVPIPIGDFEAQALLTAIHKQKLPRPMPYDLLQTVLERFQWTLRRLVVHSLRENIFYAYLVIDTQERSFLLDCRPSDGMVMATRLEAPIYVTPEVMEQAGVKSQF